MHRRDFLQPTRLAESAGHVLGALDELRQVAADAPQEASLLRLARRAMATSFEVILPFGSPYALEIGADAFTLLDELEAQLTVYRDDSEVSRLNRLAPLRSVELEPRLFELLRLAARITRETGGAFDVSAGALVKAWGFYKGPRRVPSDADRQSALARTGMHHVEFDESRRAVRLQRAGLELNLGSIGKGYALDRVAALLRERWNLRTILLQGGYSSVYAGGAAPGNPRGWPVAIRHPSNPERQLATVYLRDRALATSAATYQHLEYNGRKLGHVLDPRTGWPAEGMASVSVLASSAAEADALSTAFFVAGLESARSYCREHPQVAAVLLPADASTPEILNLSAAEFDPA